MQFLHKQANLLFSVMSKQFQLKLRKFIIFPQLEARFSSKCPNCGKLTQVNYVGCVRNRFLENLFHCVFNFVCISGKFVNFKSVFVQRLVSKEPLCLSFYAYRSIGVSARILILSTFTISTPFG